MNRSRWAIVSICVAGWLLVAWSLDWLTQKFAEHSVERPSRLAYKPVDEMPAAVDLASIQRGWPDTLTGAGESRRLRAYMHDMSGQVPVTAAGPQPGVAAGAPAPDLGTLLASADANLGKDKAQACKSCHEFAAGGPPRIGPPLWQIVGRDVASQPGFAYSAAMAGMPGTWTYERLDEFLARPSRTVPGTKMSFAGMRRPEDRAAVISYLASLGGNPPPFPPPQAGGGAPKAR
jgi:cytochrome c